MLIYIVSCTTVDIIHTIYIVSCTIVDYNTYDLHCILYSCRLLFYSFRQVLPLSLLSFRACTQIYSLSRTPVKTDNINFKKLSKAHGKTAYNETLPLDKRSSPSLDGQVLKCSSLPVELESSDPERSKDNICDGQYRPLNSCYRKHVKPKKQHEILQLGKVRLFFSLPGLKGHEHSVITWCPIVIKVVVCCLSLTFL